MSRFLRVGASKPKKIAVWLAELQTPGLTPALVHKRLSLGQSPERALLTPKGGMTPASAIAWERERIEREGPPPSAAAKRRKLRQAVERIQISQHVI